MREGEIGRVNALAGGAQRLRAVARSLIEAVKDPGYRPEALRTARKRIDAAYLSFAHTEHGPMN